jgi:hypothetical protein
MAVTSKNSKIPSLPFGLPRLIAASMSLIRLDLRRELSFGFGPIPSTSGIACRLGQKRGGIVE